MSTPLVGIIDQAISPNDTISWDVNKIGGTPVWLNEPPPQELLQCLACGQQLSLLTQLYCPLDKSPYHRVLYVFVCCKHSATCQCQFRVFRCLQFDSSYHKAEESNDLHETHSIDHDMWVEDQDDWGDDIDGGWSDDTNAWNQTESGESHGTSCCETLTLTSDSSNKEPPFCKDTCFCTNCDSDTCRAKIVADIELPDAINEIKIEDTNNEEHHSDLKDSLPSSDGSQDRPSTSAAQPHERDGVVAEDIGPLSDRFEQLARILNTKFPDERTVGGCCVTGPGQREQGPILEAYYLSVVEEGHLQSSDDKLSEHVTDLIKEYEKSEGKQIETLFAEGSKSKGKGLNEAYEKSELKHGDKMFHKFMKKLQRCPEQCIRYDRGGDPLLARELIYDTTGIPPCPNCGSNRIFEFQLLPAVIPWLKLRGSGNRTNIEFCTLLIFTCPNNCVPSESGQEFLDEMAVCQEDPDQHLFR